MKIVVNQSCQDEMNAHAEETFPEECCGTMLGRELEDGSREIVQIIRVENTKGENRERRFLIDPRSLLAAERTAKTTMTCRFRAPARCLTSSIHERVLTSTGK